jgi:hypothetical protein
MVGIANIEERKGGRVVEGTGLENRQRGNSFVGSNPTLSARASKELQERRKQKAQSRK